MISTRRSRWCVVVAVSGERGPSEREGRRPLERAGLTPGGLCSGQMDGKLLCAVWLLHVVGSAIPPSESHFDAAAAADRATESGRGEMYDAFGQPRRTPAPAYYILWKAMLAGPDWPSAFLPYSGGVIIMDPFNVTKEDIAQIKAELNATVLMYFDTTDIAVPATDGVCAANDANCNSKFPCSTGGPGLCCTTFDCDRFKNAKLCPADSFYHGLSQVFEVDWTVNLLENGTRRPLCKYYFGPVFVPFQKSIDALVPYVASWVKKIGFDGLYLDEFFPSASIALPLPLLQNRQFDADGDGKPETVAAVPTPAINGVALIAIDAAIAQIFIRYMMIASPSICVCVAYFCPEQVVQQFQQFQPKLVSGLRSALGQHAIIIANTVVGQHSSALNGLTIEMEACTGSNYDRCVATLIAQHNVSVQPAFAILWLTGESASNPAATQCARVAQMQAQLPWVLVGTDFYDGSHVVCNHTFGIPGRSVAPFH